MTTRDEQGWAIDPHTPDATQSRPSLRRSTELTIDSAGDLEVRIEEGQGYMSQSASTWIPRYILVGLLERVGATVTWPTPLSSVLPDDYEQCGTCGFDHAYEYEEAVQAHNLL